MSHETLGAIVIVVAALIVVGVVTWCLTKE